MPGRERSRTIGGDGTPPVGDLCIGEFAAVAGLSLSSGFRLIGDALDLRHRFPQIWARICAYQVPVWVCRRIAHQTGHLSLAAALFVDAAVAPYLSSLPPGRLLTLVEAKIIEADPAEAEARARFAQAQRFVRTGRTTDCGIKTLIARAEAGDVIMFTALCDRIAQILGLNGDPDPLDVRRSKAIGIIANPLRTITLLAEYEGRNLTDPPEPGRDGAIPTDPPPAPTDPDDADSGRSAGPVGDPAPLRPDDPAVIGESDLHPAHHDPFRPVDYAAALQTILDRHKLSPRDLLPRTVLYLHLDRNTLLHHCGVARVEDVGPITPDQVRHWIRGQHLTITPVIDPDNTPAADSYQTTQRIKDALRMITPAEAFPYGTNTSRRIDHDHITPYRPPPHGPPGQTSTATMTRLGRTAHRLKTHAGWQVRTPEPGTTIWRTPHGWYFLVNQAGTLPLGKSDYARTIWNTMINDFTAVRYPDDDEPDELAG